MNEITTLFLSSIANTHPESYFVMKAKIVLYYLQIYVQVSEK